MQKRETFKSGLHFLQRVFETSGTPCEKCNARAENVHRLIFLLPQS
jgi:hypothetical protein